MPDGARSAVHQHHSSVERTRREPRRPELVHGQRAVGGHRGHAQARRDVEADAVGQPHRPARGHDRELLRRPRRALVSSEEEPDAVADLQIGDVRADGVDDTGAVLVRHDLVVARAACRPPPGLPVRRVDARHGDADPDLVGSGHCRLTVDEFEDG